MSLFYEGEFIVDIYLDYINDKYINYSFNFIYNIYIKNTSKLIFI